MGGWLAGEKTENHQSEKIASAVPRSAVYKTVFKFFCLFVRARLYWWNNRKCFWVQTRLWSAIISIRDKTCRCVNLYTWRVVWTPSDSHRRTVGFYLFFFGFSTRITSNNKIVRKLIFGCPRANKHRSMRPKEWFFVDSKNVCRVILFSKTLSRLQFVRIVIFW